MSACAKITKFGAHVKELRIHLCQSDQTSKGVRDFIKKYYVDLKTSNPKLPILVRECSGVQPKIWVRQEKGKEYCAAVTNVEADEVLAQLESLARKKI